MINFTYHEQGEITTEININLLRHIFVYPVLYKGACTHWHTCLITLSKNISVFYQIQRGIYK